MLEKACMAVEEAAKGGGVYPEVLFEVAHQWYWLYEQSVGGGSGQQREVPGRCGANGGPGRRPPETSCSILDTGASLEAQGMAAVTASVTATAVVPVLSVGSTIYQSHALPGQPLAHPHSQGLHPYTTIQAHLPTVCSPQYLGHTLQHVPRPAVFPVSGAAYPQVRHAVHARPFSLTSSSQRHVHTEYRQKLEQQNTKTNITIIETEICSDGFLFISLFLYLKPLTIWNLKSTHLRNTCKISCDILISLW